MGISLNRARPFAGAIGVGGDVYAGSFFRFVASGSGPERTLTLGLPPAGGSIDGAVAKRNASGEATAVVLAGPVFVTSGAAFASGDTLGTDAAGQAVPVGAGTPVARALEAAPGAGQSVAGALL